VAVFREKHEGDMLMPERQDVLILPGELFGVDMAYAKRRENRSDECQNSE